MSHIVSNLIKYVIFAGLLFLFSNAWSASSTGQELFEKRCVACHKLPNPAVEPTVGWEQQLEVMGALARLKKGQKEEVLAYLQTHSRAAAMDAALDEDQVLFEEKCSRCHSLDRIFLEPLRGEDLQHVVSRMQNKSGTDWLSDEEVERVLEYLTSAPRETVAAVALDDSTTPDQIFAVRCSGCHSLERIFSKLGESADTADFWSHTVSRMRGKAPQWMPESEAIQILEYLRTIEPASP